MNPLVRIFLPAFFLGLNFNADVPRIDMERTKVKAQASPAILQAKGLQYPLLHFN